MKLNYVIINVGDAVKATEFIEKFINNIKS